MRAGKNKRTLPLMQSKTDVDCHGNANPLPFHVDADARNRYSAGADPAGSAWPRRLIRTVSMNARCSVPRRRWISWSSAFGCCGGAPRDCCARISAAPRRSAASGSVGIDTTGRSGRSRPGRARLGPAQHSRSSVALGGEACRVARRRCAARRQPTRSARHRRGDELQLLAVQDRATLRRYFAQVREALADDGLFFLDAYGGYDAFREIVEERQIADDEGSFTYAGNRQAITPSPAA
jgi:hypothetical protein